ncbi:recombinase family protein [Pantoea dispersa]|uniref:recombinase family protein n=1 Tax=Pantoea dispersa TaxID=59814 RepID=UPI0021F7417B|nr:recombinase family protein [Pantoea dispersa]MCW0320089.1 hypothetical protein [Pantoea dispersa]MCW0324825.1 hypothetical protein [Pantoea dispersa]MCW0431447.1 hypothetical protein [Pantoea dispersa]
MKKAIAYLRFSSLQQAKGDSARRQKKLISEWLSNNPDYYLDPVTYEDMGLSAWRGHHAVRGAFAVFMAAVERGLVGHGTVLLIESLDRLSREKIGEATGRLRTVLEAGIDVVTLSDNVRYTRGSLDDPFATIRAILIAQRANEESETKSRRMRAAWAEKRKAAAAGIIMTMKCPYWLKVNATRDGFDVMEERAEVIRSIFRMRLEGMSFVRISCALNAQGKENLKGKVSQWNSSSIERLVRKKAVIGYLVPSNQCTATGANEIAGYYPPIISEQDFARAQMMYREPESRKDGNFNPYLINIFRGLMRCGLCGHAVILTGISVKGYGYYVCSMRRQNRCEAVTIRRDLTDRYLINGLVQEASASGGRVSSEEALRPMTARHLQLTGSLQNVIRAIEIAPDVAELCERAKSLSGDIRRLEEEMATVRQMRECAAVMPLNMLDISDRRMCQHTARSLIREIRMHTEAKTCDIFLNNGMKIHNYPLSRQVGWSSIIDAMAYLGEKEIYL